MKHLFSHHCEEVLSRHTHLQPPRSLHSKHKLLNKIIFHVFVLFCFSSRWIQPKRKGRPTPSSHPEVISACSSLPKLRSCLCCCCLNAHPSPSFVPLRDGRWGEQKLRWGSVRLVGEGRGPGKVHLAVCLSCIYSWAIACVSCILPGLAAGIDKLLLQVGRDELYPSRQPHRVRRSPLVCYGL